MAATSLSAAALDPPEASLAVTPLSCHEDDTLPIDECADHAFIIALATPLRKLVSESGAPDPVKRYMMFFATVKPPPSQLKITLIVFASPIRGTWGAASLYWCPET
jgi:hypothetical protein